jgi:hypothetical protein
MSELVAHTIGEAVSQLTRGELWEQLRAVHTTFNTRQRAMYGADVTHMMAKTAPVADGQVLRQSRDLYYFDAHRELSYWIPAALFFFVRERLVDISNVVIEK